MREIKFRGWYESDKEKVMLHEDYPGQVFKWKDEGQPLKIMQSTGLKDKNGVVIFEGDIVKQTYHKEIAVKYDPDDYGYIGSSEIWGHHIGEVVITASMGACIRNPLEVVKESSPYKTKIYKNLAGYRCEILGNIHQHPELLKNE